MKFDSNKSKTATNTLSEETKNNLRNTHYNLGYEKNQFTTTHNSTYVSKENNQKINSENHFKSNIVFNPKNSDLTNKSIYMLDYTLKNCE